MYAHPELLDQAPPTVQMQIGVHHGALKHKAPCVDKTQCMTIRVLHWVVPEGVHGRPGEGVAMVLAHQVNGLGVESQLDACLACVSQGGPAKEQPPVCVLHEHDQHQQHDD